MNIPDRQLQPAASALVARFRIFALATKHHGFAEEQEWRFVYSKQFDRSGSFTSMLDYAIGPHGIEPKFKLKVEPTVALPNLSLSILVERIILGPTLSEAISVEAFKRMLRVMGKDYLITRVVASGTPFRPTRK